MTLPAGNSRALPRRAALAAAILFFVGCSTPPARSAKDRPVITLDPVGGLEGPRHQSVITEAEVRYELARTRLERQGTIQATPLPSVVKERILEELIDRRTLLLEAEAMGVRASTAAVAKEIRRMEGTLSEHETKRQLVETYQTEDDLKKRLRERLTVGRLLMERAHQGVAVSEQELTAAWEELPKTERVKAARVHASQIVVRTEEEGSAVIAALKAGKTTFEKLALEHSIGPEGARGGDLGWFEPGVMPKVFDDVCFTLKPGTISPLTPSEYGFHLFKVLEAEPPATLTFEDMKERLQARILMRKLEAAEAKYVQEVRAKYRVTRNKRALAAIE